MNCTATSATGLLSAGLYINIAPIAPDTFHIRLNRTGTFAACGPLASLGLVAPPAADVLWNSAESEEAIELNTGLASLRIERLCGAIGLYDRNGSLLARLSGLSPIDADDFEARFDLTGGELVYGLGDQYDTPLMKRGCSVTIGLRVGRVHAPVPLLLSDAGWALLSDTEMEHEFDVGRSEPDQLLIRGAGSEWGFYWMVGGNLAELLGKAAELTGPAALLPKWAYGLTFICNQQSTARDLIEDGLKFRREGIPCDMLGLEPSWMDRPFDYENPVRWNQDRFYIPQWMPEGEHTFMGALKTMGFKLSLSLPLPEKKRIGDEKPASGAFYELLRPFVAQGVKGFKLCTSLPFPPEARAAVSADQGEESVSLTEAGSISGSIMEGFANQTGRRPMIYSPVGYTGIQKYAAMWSGGRQQPHLSVLSLGLSGIPHMSVAMNLHTPAGIHFGFLQPWSEVNSWAYWRHPLLLEKRLLDMFKAYARLRYRLLPYIYSAAHVAVRTGLPIARAMPLAFPGDAKAAATQNQYMFGDELLVGVFTERVYLPEGEWINYWTGERHHGPTDLHCDVPEPFGGPLFVRAGAIVPMAPDMEYVHQQSTERLELHLYPGRANACTLYEDDGVSLDYLRGQTAETHIGCRYEKQSLLLEIAPRSGDFYGMPGERTWEIVVHMHNKPAAVRVDGELWREVSGSRKQPVPGTWSVQRKAGTIRLTVREQTAKRREPLCITLAFSIASEARLAAKPAQAAGSRRTVGEWEKEVEIGLETGDADKALSALAQWWEVRTTSAGAPGELREHWLYMNGLFVRSVERKGRTLSEVAGDEQLRLLQLEPDHDAGQAYESLRQLAALIVDYDNRQGGRTHETVRLATDMIMQEIDRELSLQAVADRLHLNSSYLSRRFKKEIGMPFSDYVLEKKMELARELLLAGSTVGAAAEHTGYKDASYFIRVFRKYWGVTPGEMKP
ncbi:helix-turn-helix domain-containing protein [Paenibacillus hodogayensis]|uniref:Helix-turn-helix domain-containing protein n=1 Tax=Paenibacillus hodogayensis TaxID=279208 RepID=A0ABV5W4F3_9BACL